MSRGRKRGLAGILATQRLNRLSKSVISEAHNHLIGLNNLDLDIRRAAETIGWDARRVFDRLPSAARLIWAAWRYREVRRQDDRSLVAPARRPLHPRGLNTGTRAGAVCGASLGPVQGSGWIDLERGVFYRKAAMDRSTKKRQPPVQIPVRLLAHMRRWRANGQTYAVERLGKPVGTGIEKAFGRACIDARLEDVTAHILRHTAATWLLANSTPFEKAADLGWSSKRLQTLGNFGRSGRI